ncbi:MAG: DNA polymerase I, partial [Trueperaceae bacterium]|nr:DNA polymerase I [Trueperaceae bacterium]
MSQQDTQTTLFQAVSELPEKPKTPEANGHKIVIIDGHALAFRSYYAIRELTNSKGVSTNAIYGFIRSLLRILKEEGENDATVVTFDAPAKTFRHEQFEDYKAGRAPMPQDLPWQIDTIKQVVEYLGLYQIEVAGLEADDLIGTIAKKTEALGYKVEIVTSDRDSYQLISDRICVRGLDKADHFGAKEVFEKYGVTVEQWTDYRALTGDSSDNIPGAKGIGPKSAQKLLETYGSLDYILEHLDSVEPAKFADKIRASLEDVKFSRELSQIVTDANLEINPVSWAAREMNAEPLGALLKDLEFGSIMRELGLEGEAPSSNYEEVAFDAALLGGAYGYVLSDQSPMRASLTELALAKDKKVTKLGKLLQNESTVNACDAKALVVYARKQGLELEAGDDPLIMAYVLDPNTNSAEAAARRYGAGEWKTDAKSRAEVTAELLSALPKQLSGQQKELYEKIEKPLQNVLADMEYCGVEVDVAELKRQSDALGQDMTRIENRVREIADNPILNLNSRDQLADLIFDKLGLQAGKKTSTGKRSTAVGALEPLRDQHEVIGLILDYREIAKLKNTYLDPLPSLLSEQTGRIHTTFNQAVVATGRLSSTNP